MRRNPRQGCNPFHTDSWDGFRKRPLISMPRFQEAQVIDQRAGSLTVAILLYKITPIL